MALPSLLKNYGFILVQSKLQSKILVYYNKYICDNKVKKRQFITISFQKAVFFKE